MRYQKAWMLLMAALLMVAASVPLSAWDGGGPYQDWIEIDERAHPWQDENGNEPQPTFDLVSAIPVGSIVITIKIRVPAFFNRFFVKEQPVVQPTVRVPSGQTTKLPQTVSRRSEVI
jgi:hypothetical protein